MSERSERISDTARSERSEDLVMRTPTKEAVA